MTMTLDEVFDEIVHVDRPNDLRVYIMRGLPGMGKSDLAELIAMARRQVYGSGSVVRCSADKHRYKTDPQTGEIKYVYKPEETGTCHMKCQEEFFEALAAEKPTVIVENTNTREKEFSFYKNAAFKAGYKVFEVIAGNLDTQASFERNAHDVPKKTIDYMATRFEFPEPDGLGTPET